MIICLRLTWKTDCFDASLLSWTLSNVTWPSLAAPRARPETEGKKLSKRGGDATGRDHAPPFAVFRWRTSHTRTYCSATGIVLLWKAKHLMITEFRTATERGHGWRPRSRFQVFFFSKKDQKKAFYAKSIFFPKTEVDHEIFSLFLFKVEYSTQSKLDDAGNVLQHLRNREGFFFS